MYLTKQGNVVIWIKTVMIIVFERRLIHLARNYSRQREMIQRYMAGRKDHPTADAVYTAVRKELPNISLGTVYRNLMLLSEEGALAKVDVGDGMLHFDPDTTRHAHFICSDCGCVLDIPSTEADDALDETVRALFPGTIDGHQTVFHGRCANCAPPA